MDANRKLEKHGEKMIAYIIVFWCIFFLVATLLNTTKKNTLLFDHLIRILRKDRQLKN